MILETFIENASIYAITGAFAGLMAGLLGIGGGMIIVPALAFVFHHTQVIPSNLEMHFAAGTSLAIMIFTAQASARAHYKKDGVLWDIYNLLWPGIILGTISGAIFANLLPTYWLKIILGIILLIFGIKMLLDLKVSRPHHLPKNWITRVISYLIGFKSGMLGLGGGAVIIPYLSFCGVDSRKIPAISALCTLNVAIIGTITVIITGSFQNYPPPYSLGYIYWPAVFLVAIPSMLFAPVGAKLTYVLPVKQLKYCFAAILLLAACDLLF